MGNLCDFNFFSIFVFFPFFLLSVYMLNKDPIM